MKLFLSACVLAGTVLAAPNPAFAAPPEPSFPVIVVFQKDTPFFQFAPYAHADARATLDASAWNYLDRGVLGAVQRLEGLHRFTSSHAYSHALRGFAASLTQAQITALKSEPTIAYIEADVEMKAIGAPPKETAVEVQTIPWGITAVRANLSSTLAGNGSGAVTNVNVYVIDSGIAAHRDLNLVRFVNFVDMRNTDCNGHGTHVAGTIGASDNTLDVVGVAPGVRLTGVKVLGCNGSGSASGVIKGIDWVTANASGPSVANMSLGGGISTALDDAVRNSSTKVFYAIAAGNSAADACTSSPARAGAGSNNGIATTAATNADNTEASFSNYGACVDIWSPGVSILSTKAGGGTTTMSGTSMASPHTAGAAALYLSTNPAATPVQVEAAITTYAWGTGNLSKDAVREVRLLQVNSF